MNRHSKLLKVFKAFRSEVGAPRGFSCCCVKVIESFSLSNNTSATIRVMTNHATANFTSSEPLKRPVAKPSLSNENNFVFKGKPTGI